MAAKIHHVGREPIVKVALPYYESVQEPLMFLTDILAVMGIPGYKVFTVREVGTVITIARNNLVTDPPGHPYDYLFFIDADMGMNREDTFAQHPDSKLPMMIHWMKQILDRRRQICGGLYCGKASPYLPQIYRYHEWRDGGKLDTMGPVLDYPKDELIEVDGIATGFLCISSDVLEAMGKERKRRAEIKDVYESWRDSRPEDFKALPEPLRNYLPVSKADISPPFWLDYIWNPVTGHWNNRGEDIDFCHKARQLGYKIWCDTGVQVGHYRLEYLYPSHFEEQTKADCLAARQLDCEKNGLKVPNDRGTEDGK